MKLFVAPHNDDEALFGSFTIQRERPEVVIVFGSYIQVRRGHRECAAERRNSETVEALWRLGVPRERIHFLDMNDAEAMTSDVIVERIQRIGRFDSVWIPAHETGGHPHHNLVAEAGLAAFHGTRIHRYLTYTHKGKSTAGSVVPFTGCMVRRKLQALACYQTQLENEALGCVPHFLDIREYCLD